MKLSEILTWWASFSNISDARKKYFRNMAKQAEQLEAENEALKKQLKWEKALTVAHSSKITWLNRVISVMLPLTPFADAEDALLTEEKPETPLSDVPITP